MALQAGNGQRWVGRGIRGSAQHSYYFAHFHFENSSVALTEARLEIKKSKINKTKKKSGRHEEKCAATTRNPTPSITHGVRGCGRWLYDGFPANAAGAGVFTEI